MDAVWVFFSHQPFCFYQLSACYLLVLSFALVLSDRTDADINTVLSSLKTELNFDVFPVKPCPFHGHACDGVLSSSRTCKAQVSGYPHYFLSGSLSALTSLHTREVSNSGCALYSLLLA